MAQILSSRIQVLAVENEDRTSKAGKEYTHFKASCIVLDDNGGVITVGALRSREIMPELRDQLKPGVTGIFRVGYGLQVSDFGEKKGDIVPMVVHLQPEKPVAPTAAAKA